MKILITGATGLVGQKLGLALVGKGHELYIISRDAARARRDLPFLCEVIEADLGRAPIKIETYFDVVVNLLGESVGGGRWTAARKKQIMDSRIAGTRNLIDSLRQPPKLILSANAIGIYGDRGSELLIETSPPGSDFLAKVCLGWEHELMRAQDKFASQTKIASLRIGLVLARAGGALEKLLFPFRAGLGGALGSGRQMMSWIHIEDLVQMFCFIIEKNASGHFNAVAPHPVSNFEFSKSLAKSLGRPFGFHIPAFVLRLMLGELGDVVLASQKVSCEKIQRLGFKFKFENLDLALLDLLGPGRF